MIQLSHGAGGKIINLEIKSRNIWMETNTNTVQNNQKESLGTVKNRRVIKGNR